MDALASTGRAGHSIVSYAWDFGDGRSAQGETTSHTYADGGQFVISLTVTDERRVSMTKSCSVVVRCPSGDLFPWLSADVGNPRIPGGHRTWVLQRPSAACATQKSRRSQNYSQTAVNPAR